MKILFCDYQIPVPHTYEKKLIEKEIPGAVFEEYVYEGDEKELYDKVADADAIMTCFLKIDRVLLEHAPKLKMISVDATGYGDGCRCSKGKRNLCCDPRRLLYG